MRLSEWRGAARHRDAMTPKVLATVEPALGAMGSEVDPECWVAWGEDPAVRYTILAPNASGLVICAVRVNVSGEGPRARAKLVRWSRVQLGELALETQAGHRIISFQVEGQVLRGADAEADRIGEFAQGVLAAADGRPIPERTTRVTRRRPAASAGRKSSATARPARKTARS
jgi:hypothetical protein